MDTCECELRVEGLLLATCELAPRHTDSHRQGTVVWDAAPNELHAILVKLPLAVAMFAQQAAKNGARIRAWTFDPWWPPPHWQPQSGVVGESTIHIRFHLVAIENRAALESVGFRCESRYAPNGPGGAGELFDAWWSSDGSAQKSRRVMWGE